MVMASWKFTLPLYHIILSNVSILLRIFVSSTHRLASFTPIKIVDKPIFTILVQNEIHTDIHIQNVHNIHIPFIKFNRI